MGSLNKVELIGYLGGDARLSETASGHPVANFNMATNEYWIAKDGKKEQRTEWHRIVLWGPQAETLSPYLKKGRQVFVSGRLQTSKWESEEKMRVTAEIVANTIRFLDAMNDGEKRDKKAVQKDEL